MNHVFVPAIQGLALCINFRVRIYRVFNQVRSESNQRHQCSGVVIDTELPDVVGQHLPPIDRLSLRLSTLRHQLRARRLDTLSYSTHGRSLEAVEGERLAWSNADTRKSFERFRVACFRRVFLHQTVQAYEKLV